MTLGLWHRRPYVPAEQVLCVPEEIAYLQAISADLSVYDAPYDRCRRVQARAARST